MRKLRLDFHALEVDSFATEEMEARPGTVGAAQPTQPVNTCICQSQAPYYDTCAPKCRPSWQTNCDPTCKDTCETCKTVCTCITCWGQTCVPETCAC